MIKIQSDLLPIATTETLGTFKIGDNLTMTSDGTLNATAQSKATVIQVIDNAQDQIVLESNNIYKCQVIGDITFVLPAVVDTVIHNQIKVYIQLASAVTINLGTSIFTNDQQPDVTIGVYEIFWDYNPFLNNWVCGALKSGA